MSGSISDYLEAKILNWLKNGTAFTPPATTYWALFTVAPTDAGGGTEVPSANNYSRVPVTKDTTNWPTATGTNPTTVSNGTNIVWPTASGGNWGTVVAVAAFDASSGGNLLEWSTLAVNKTITDGDTFSIPAGSYSLTAD
jgi:hypothetical protein